MLAGLPAKLRSFADRETAEGAEVCQGDGIVAGLQLLQRHELTAFCREVGRAPLKIATRGRGVSVTTDVALIAAVAAGSAALH